MTKEITSRGRRQRRSRARPLARADVGGVGALADADEARHEVGLEAVLGVGAGGAELRAELRHLEPLRRAQRRGFVEVVVVRAVFSADN